MHYIIGTSFSVKPDPRRGFKSRENQFNINVTYRLLTITVQPNNILDYTFDGADKRRVVMSFETSRDADAFIAKLRNEQLPDYNAEIGKLDV